MIERRKSLSRVALLIAVPIGFATVLSGHAALAQKRVLQPVPVATAQAAPAAAARATDAELKSLVETLEDETARNKLIGQINALLATRHGTQKPRPAERGMAQFIDRASDRIERASGQILAVAAFLADAPRIKGWFERQIEERDRRDFWMQLIWKVALVLAGALAAGWLARLIVARPRHAIEGRNGESLWLQSWFLVGRTVLELLPLAAFAVAAYVILPTTGPDKPTRLVALSLVNAILIARVLFVAARAVLAPRVASLRLTALTDETANYLYVWTRRFVNIAVYGYFLAETALLLNMPEAGYHAIRATVGILLTLLAIAFILQNRDGGAAWIRGDAAESEVSDAGVLRRRLADIWHVLAIVYIIAVFTIWVLQIENGSERVVQGSLLTLIVITLIILLSRWTAWTMRRALSIGEDMSGRFPGLETRANRYLGIVQHTMRAVIIVIGLSAILQAWGIDSFAWLATPFGQRMIESLLVIALILVASVLVWELVNSAIERHLSRSEDDSTRVSARALTLLPLIRSITTIVLATLVVLIALSQLGINIAPLLAGAGVIGLAVGFGAQTLVKDVITGFFILSEDQIAVGDVVRVGSHGGLVESLTIRTVRLRDLAGNVHIIPFSEVTTVENMTKEFSRYVFDVGVAYREDTDQVVEVLKSIGEDMVADPHFGELITAPLEILGVDAFADSAVIVKARITTKPIKQWEVGREFNRRMKKRFDELGIEIPFPHRTIYFGEDKEGRAPPARIRTAPDGGEEPARSGPIGFKPSADGA